MTKNHHQDKEMLDEVERVLNHQASEHELLTALSRTVPQAETDFQNSLEKKLVAQLKETTQKQETGDSFMKLFDEKSKRKKQPSPLPFTLVAAMIAIALIGGLIVFTSLNNSGVPYNADSIPEGIALTATQIINDATATGIARNMGQSIVATDTPISFMLTATAIIEDATATGSAIDTGQIALSATAVANSDENLSNSGQNNCYYVGLVENYAVSERDTLFTIAENFEVDAQTILTANCFGDALSIQVGQIIQIPIETIPVVVAVQDIPAGIEITADYVTIINFPVSSSPSSIFSNIDDVVGLIAQTTLRGEGAIHTYLVSDSYREDFMRVVIALRDIELNETITEDMVTTVQYNLDDAWSQAQNNRGNFYYNNEGVVIGQRASTFIPYHQPIHSNNVTEAQNCQDNVVGCATIEGYLAMGMIITDRTPLVLPLGTRVDVIAALQFIDIGDTSQAIMDDNDLPLDIVPSIMMNTIVGDAILLDVDDSGDDIIVYLALLRQDSLILEYMLEAGVPLRFVPHVEQIEQTRAPLNFSRLYPLTDEGLAMVSIPLTQVNTDTVVNIGDIFDIQFSILPDEVDLLSAMPTPQAGDVIERNSISSTYGIILEIEDSTVVYVGRGSDGYPNPSADDSLFMTVSVNPDDAWIVDWYTRNGANFTLRPRN